MNSQYLKTLEAQGFSLKFNAGIIGPLNKRVPVNKSKQNEEDKPTRKPIIKNKELKKISIQEYYYHKTLKFYEILKTDEVLNNLLKKQNLKLPFHLRNCMSFLKNVYSIKNYYQQSITDRIRFLSKIEGFHFEQIETKGMKKAVRENAQKNKRPKNNSTKGYLQNNMSKEEKLEVECDVYANKQEDRLNRKKNKAFI
ncbi:hypothetical protein ABK040_013512 [Willaertia magna]